MSGLESRDWWRRAVLKAGGYFSHDKLTVTIQQALARAECNKARAILAAKRLAEKIP